MDDIILFIVEMLLFLRKLLLILIFLLCWVGMLLVVISIFLGFFVRLVIGIFISFR